MENMKEINNFEQNINDLKQEISYINILGQNPIIELNHGNQNIKNNEPAEAITETYSNFDEDVKKYSKIYRLSEINSKLVFDFLHENSEIISDKALLGEIILDCIEDKKMVKANEADVKRAINLTMSNKNEKKDIDNFFDLLVLFFASKYNLNERIEVVLNNQE